MRSTTASRRAELSVSPLRHSAGTPMSLVRDGHTESPDDPPDESWSHEPEPIIPVGRPDSSRRADDAQREGFDSQRADRRSSDSDHLDPRALSGSSACTPSRRYGTPDLQYAMSVPVREETFQRASVTLARSAILLSVLVATVGWCIGPAAAQKASTPSLERSRAIPKLVPAPGQLRDQCGLAATRLGFPVPCPQLVPSLSGRAMSCPRPVGAASAFPPCVGVDGATQYELPPAQRTVAVGW